MIAHVAGVPLEEALPALAGTSTLLLAARAWLMLRLRGPGACKPVDLRER